MHSSDCRLALLSLWNPLCRVSLDLVEVQYFSWESSFFYWFFKNHFVYEKYTVYLYSNEISDFFGSVPSLIILEEIIQILFIWLSLCLLNLYLYTDCISDFHYCFVIFFAYWGL